MMKNGMVFGITLGVTSGVLLGVFVHSAFWGLLPLGICIGFIVDTKNKQNKS